MHALFRIFIRSESGAASVDWPVIAALIVGVPIAVGIMVYEGGESATVEITETLEDEDLPDQIFPGRTTASP